MSSNDAAHDANEGIQLSAIGASASAQASPTSASAPVLSDASLSPVPVPALHIPHVASSNSLAGSDVNGNGNGNGHLNGNAVLRPSAAQSVADVNGNGNGNGTVVAVGTPVNPNSDYTPAHEKYQSSPSDVKSPSDSKSETAGAPAALKVTYAISDAEKEVVHRLYDESRAEYLDAIDSLNEAQMAYYADTITPDKMRVLNAKGARVAGDTESEPNVTLSWRNLSYTKKGEKQPRLHGLTGVLRPKQTVCVLGGPDAGITSLLMVLSGSNQGGTVTGERLLNGAPYDASLRRRIAFVPKDDLHLSTLTLQETLEFAARLRLPSVLSEKAKKLRAVNVMKLLGLRHAANTIVGSDTLRGISGGEKRRLSIGVEMVGGQMSLIADLPTNGLDSASAYEMLATYKKMAQHSGRSLMASLVQPSPELLDLFDSVLLMSKGYCVYYGPRATIEQHFFGLGYRMPIATEGEQKSVPDYLAEVSVQPEHYYQGESGVTDEKGQVIVKWNVKVKETAPRKSTIVITEVSPATATVGAPAPAALLDDLASRDPSLMVNDANGVRVYVPRTSMSGAAVPALSGGVPLDAESKAGGGVLVNVRAAPPVLSANHIKAAEAESIGAVSKRSTATPKRVRPRISHFEAENHIIMAYKASNEFKAISEEVELIHKAPKPADPNAYAYNSSFMLQLRATISRQMALTWRNPAASSGAIIQALIQALLVGSLFWQIGTNQKDMRTRFGLFFFAMMFQMMGSLGAIPALLEHRLVFYVQTGNGLFRGPAFFISYMISQVPVIVVSTYVFLFIQYPMSGLTGGIGSTEFGYLSLDIILISLVARALCMMVAAISPNQAVALGLTPIALMLNMMFGGFMVPRDSIPDGWIWMYYISFFTWALRGSSQNELMLKTFNCAPEEYLQISPLSTPVCPIPDGVAALAQYNMDPSLHADGTPDTSEKWVSIENLVWFFIAFNFAACVALSIVNFYNNDASMVATLSQDDDEEDEADGHIKDVEAVGANGNGNVSGKAKRNAANGHHVVAMPTPAPEPVVPGAARQYEMTVTPTTLSFHNLTYSVPIKGQKEPKELLKKTFGFVKPGMMVALMGPSGAGKSTLLDVLANKKNIGSINGSLLINGKPRDKSFQLIAGYVEQTDSHNEYSTVREAIEFSAHLRLPLEMSEEEKMERVEAVLDKLGLRYVQHRQIGSVEHGGISPELRKKVTIGVELVMNPAILFLDEPTTGLDSMAAMAVMDAVRRLAKTISVVCTVHQPSAEIVEKFDYMLLMQKGGEVAYCGPIDKLSKYLGSVGLGECPKGRNIADHALEVAGGGIKLNSVVAGPNPAQLFATSPEAAAIKQEVAALGHDITATTGVNIPLGDAIKDGEAPAACGGMFENDTATGFGNQLLQLTRRFAISSYRDKATFNGRVGSILVTSFIFSTLYFQLGHGQADASNRVSLFFLTGLYPSFSAGEAIPKIVDSRPVYFRERQSKMYTTLAYFLGRLLGGLPLIFVETTIYSCIMYFVADLNQGDASEHFWVFYATFATMRIFGFIFAEWCASMFEKAEAAAGIQSLILTLFMLFAGYLVAKASIPIGWIWMYYISIFRYPISLLANNELQGLQFNCDGNKGAIGPLALYNESATNDPFTMACSSEPKDNTTCYGYLCPLTSGDQMLQQFNIDGDSKGGWYGIIVLMTCFYAFVGYLTLKKVQHIKR